MNKQIGTIINDNNLTWQLYHYQLNNFNSLHTKLFQVFKHDEAIPLKQNNETKF